MTSRYLPRIDQPGAGGGGPPPTVEDHFAPKFIVGNVPNGDPAVAQAAPFRYIPDPGDGSGLALALTEAAAGPGGDVYLRPGIYDLGLPGSPGLPLSVPSNVSLRGPGVGVPVAFGGTPANGVLIRGDADLRSLLTLGAAASARQLAFEIVAPNVGASGTVFIDGAGGGAPSFFDQVAVFISASSNDAVNESLTRIFRGTFVTFTNVIIVSNNPYQPGASGGSDLIGYEGTNMQADKVQVQNIDVGFLLNDTSSMDNIQVLDCRTGVDITAGAAGVRIGELFATVTERALYDRGAFATAIANMQAFGPGTQGTGAVGIELSGGAATSSACRMSNIVLGGFDAPYVDAGAQNGLSNAQISGTLLPGGPGISLSGFQPSVHQAMVTSVDIGVESSASITELSGVHVSAADIGFALRSGLVEAQLSNCRSNHPTGPGVGTGLQVDAGAVSVTATNFYARSHDEGVDYGGDNFTLLGANLQGNTTPIVVTGTPASPEVAHIQT